MEDDRAEQQDEDQNKGDDVHVQYSDPCTMVSTGQGRRRTCSETKIYARIFGLAHAGAQPAKGPDGQIRESLLRLRG